MSRDTRPKQVRCGWLSLGEGRICDKPAVGVYIGLGGRQAVCEKHRDWLRRRWGIDVRPLPGEGGHSDMSQSDTYRTPTVALLCKLGSIARHADELTGPTGHPTDADAIRSLLDDPEVSEWLAQLDALSLLPVKR